jgi:hypothetical protein
MENRGEAWFYTRPVYVAQPHSGKTETDIKPASRKKESKASLPEIHFYPEGGNLIAGHTNRVAFKALLAGSQAVEISGAVFNSRDEKQTSFDTFHEGMGAFNLAAGDGERYYARYEYNDRSYNIQLPEVKTGARALRALWEGDSLSIAVLKAEATSVQTFYLLIHQQGIPKYFQPWDFSIPEKKFHKDKFSTGVAHLMLLTHDFIPVSERMVFNYAGNCPGIEISTDKTQYRPREKVLLDIHSLNMPEDTVPASLAISVTDDRDIKIDTTTHIAAEILLASELEGTIRHPSGYFRNDEKAAQAADLLMLTHGWRRYNVAEALQGNLQKPAVKPEITYSFSGTLKKPSGKPYKKGRIKMTAVGYNYSDVVESDNEGHYLFTGFEFPDSTAYFFLSYTNEKTEAIKIVPDEPAYPPVTIPCNPPAEYQEIRQNDKQFAAAVEKFNRKYVCENGTRMVNLPEVSVKARRKEKKKRYNNYTPLVADRWISPDDIRNFTPASFEDLFFRLQGVSNVSPERGVIAIGKSAQFALNGRLLDCSYDQLSEYVNINDIAQVELFVEPAQTLFFSQEGGSVIALTTWPPGENFPDANDNNDNKKVLLPVGYRQPVEFYSPKYDVPEIIANPTPDLRSTIYWKPNVFVDNKTSLEFYTADNPTSYTIVIEGIGGDGKLIYLREKALITVKN